MFEESLLIAILKERTGYKNVDYTREMNIDMSLIDENLPKIYVGHRSVDPFAKTIEDLTASGYGIADVRRILTTDIQVICNRKSLVEILTNIEAACLNWSPFPDDSDYSSIFPLPGRVLAITNNKIWWLYSIGYIFPRIY